MPKEYIPQINDTVSYESSNGTRGRFKIKRIMPHILCGDCLGADGIAAGYVRGMGGHIVEVWRTVNNKPQKVYEW